MSPRWLRLYGWASLFAIWTIVATNPERYLWIALPLTVWILFGVWKQRRRRRLSTGLTS